MLRPHTVVKIVSLFLQLCSATHIHGLIKANSYTRVLRKLNVLALGCKDISAARDCTNSQAFQWPTEDQTSNSSDSRANADTFRCGRTLCPGFNFTFGID